MDQPFDWIVLAFAITILLGFLRVQPSIVGIVGVVMFPAMMFLPELIHQKNLSETLLMLPFSFLENGVPSFLGGLFGGWVGKKIVGAKLNEVTSIESVDGKYNAKHIKGTAFIKLVLIGGSLIVLVAYLFNPYVTWKEEVKLNDGRVIVVKQKKFKSRGIAREAWLTIDLPEFSTQPIVWHENLDPLIVNIDGGRLYVVGFPPTGLEIRQYGNQTPPYIGFVWENGKFVRIPFKQIPEKIYDTNMLIESFPPKGSAYLMTLQQKNAPDVNGEPTLQHMWRINPNMGCGC